MLSFSAGREEPPERVHPLTVNVELTNGCVAISRLVVTLVNCTAAASPDKSSQLSCPTRTLETKKSELLKEVPATDNTVEIDEFSTATVAPLAQAKGLTNLRSFGVVSDRMVREAPPSIMLETLMGRVAATLSRRIRPPFVTPAPR